MLGHSHGSFVFAVYVRGMPATHINGIFLAVGVESQSGICSELVYDIHHSLLMFEIWSWFA